MASLGKRISLNMVDQQKVIIQIPILLFLLLCALVFIEFFFEQKSNEMNFEIPAFFIEREKTINNTASVVSSEFSF